MTTAATNSSGVTPPEDIARMTTAQVDFGNTEVPLPVGADAGSTWEDWNGQFRVVSAERRMIDGTTWASAVQLPDGPS